MTDESKSTIGALVGLALISLLAWGMYSAFNNSGSSLGGPSTSATTASTTAFILTTTSQLLLATSSSRVAATIQPINCSGTVTTFLDKTGPNTANTGTAAFSSTTLAFDDYQSPRITKDPVWGITNAGTCTVLVTEWRQ